MTSIRFSTRVIPFGDHGRFLLVSMPVENSFDDRQMRLDCFSQALLCDLAGEEPKRWHMANRIDVMTYLIAVLKYLRHTRQLAACITIGCAITACHAFGQQKLEGTVWDRATWKPIEGGLVVATYSKLADGVVVTKFASFCHKSAMVMTGLDGKFEFPRDWKYGLPHVSVFKSKYVLSSMPRDMPPGAKKQDPVLKSNPYKSAMDYPFFKEREKVTQSVERGTYDQEYPNGTQETLVANPFGGCVDWRGFAMRNDRAAWIELLKAEVKEMERLNYPKQQVENKQSTILNLENAPDPKS